MQQTFPTSALLEAVAVTSELCGRVFSPAAAQIFVDDLSGYPEDQVLGALKRCRREVRGVLTVQDVVSRLDDGRPGPDEAWAMIPRDEMQSVVWTDEIAHAASIATPLLEAGDKAGAQRAFRETYTKAVNDAREKRQPVHWWASLGMDPHGRETALLRAADAGRVTLEYARALLPSIGAADTVMTLLGSATKAIEQAGR